MDQDLARELNEHKEGFKELIDEREFGDLDRDVSKKRQL